MILVLCADKIFNKKDLIYIKTGYNSPPPSSPARKIND